jgi:DNA polymerase II small subunit
VGNEKSIKLAERVKYVIIAGDIVDGVGVYPGQDRELEIIDINGQYEEAAMQIAKMPDRVRIIISPGNHDAVRQAEPQPALPKEFASLFPKNVMHVGNPSMLDVEGVKLLIYHGRSIDDLVMKIPRLEYERPHQAMIEMLRRRHLAPLYGNRTLIAPEREDYLVVDDIPDILHCGHVHTYGTAYYRGIFLVNSSCWQSQTEFQKKVNLNPIPGNVTVYQPGGEPIRLNFYSA